MANSPHPRRTGGRFSAAHIEESPPLFQEFLDLAQMDSLGESAPFCADDALLVVGMQNDWVPLDPASNPNGGRLGITEGGLVVPTVVDLIRAATRAGATVCAVRDYHPVDHCCFRTHGGAFPVHCVQGSEGSRFCPLVSKALADGVAKNGPLKVFVAFKGFHEADNFTGGEGKDGSDPERRRSTVLPTSSAWNARVLKQSRYVESLHVGGKDGGLSPKSQQTASWGSIDVDAPPDVLAATSDGVARGLKSLSAALGGKKRLFVCGLALDFCVLDTCLSEHTAGFEKVSVVLDASRALHLPGIGPHGSGFYSEPTTVLQQLQDAGVAVVGARSLTKQVMQRARTEPIVHFDEPEGFPKRLPPIGLVEAHVNIELARPSFADRNNNKQRLLDYLVHLTGPLAQLGDDSLGIDNAGHCTWPPEPLRDRWPGAPPSATHGVWAYPIKGMSALANKEASHAALFAFLSLATSAELCFIAYGGFVLLDSKYEVAMVQAVNLQNEPSCTLKFGPPRTWPPAHEACLERTGRLQDVTHPVLLQAGAKKFCWFHPNEQLQLDAPLTHAEGHAAAAGTPDKAANDPDAIAARRRMLMKNKHVSAPAGLSTVPTYTPSKTGCFVYTRADAKPILFPVLQPPREHVAYVTDVEGNWEYFLAFIERSEGLHLKGVRPDGAADIELKEGWRLVHGGDAVDKGGEVGGSVRVVRSLVRLKHKYGERVTLILGNRDCNKIRVSSELGDAEMEPSRLHVVPGPFWVPEGKRVPPVTFLRKMVGERDSVGAAEVSDAALHDANTKWNRLKWMLKETMGAAGEEERRRCELSQLDGGRHISDEEVVASFLSSVSEGGWMREYMRVGQLAAIIDGSLFVHGGVVGSAWEGGALDNIGFVPGEPERIDGVANWVEKLNAWKDAQYEEWVAMPEWSPPPETADVTSGLRGGNGLIHYCVGDGSPPSVVGGRHLEKRGMPRPLEAKLCATLVAENIFRLVVGHTPHGNSPTLVQCDEHLLIVMADTSYSDMKEPDNRGSACSSVAVMNDGTVRVDGVLPASVEDGARVSFAVSPSPASRPYELIGRIEPEVDANGEPTPERKFVKARLAEGGHYLLCHVDGFSVKYSKATDAETREMLGVPRKPVTDVPSHTEFSSTGDEGDESRRELIAAIFAGADENGDNQLDVTELARSLDNDPALLKLLVGTGNEPPDAHDLLQEMDANGQGTVSVDEFVAFFCGRVVKPEEVAPPPASTAIPHVRRTISEPVSNMSQKSLLRPQPVSHPSAVLEESPDLAPSAAAHDAAKNLRVMSEELDAELTLCRQQLDKLTTAMGKRRRPQPDA